VEFKKNWGGINQFASPGPRTVGLPRRSGGGITESKYKEENSESSGTFKLWKPSVWSKHTLGWRNDPTERMPRSRIEDEGWA